MGARAAAWRQPALQRLGRAGSWTAASALICQPRPQLKTVYWFMLTYVVNAGMVTRRWA